MSTLLPRAEQPPWISLNRSQAASQMHNRSVLDVARNHPATHGGTFQLKWNRQYEPFHFKKTHTQYIYIYTYTSIRTRKKYPPPPLYYFSLKWQEISNFIWFVSVLDSSTSFWKSPTFMWFTSPCWPLWSLLYSHFGWIVQQPRASYWWHTWMVRPECRAWIYVILYAIVDARDNRDSVCQRVAAAGTWSFRPGAKGSHHFGWQLVSSTWGTINLGCVKLRVPQASKSHTI